MHHLTSDVVEFGPSECWFELQDQIVDRDITILGSLIDDGSDFIQKHLSVAASRRVAEKLLNNQVSV
jgi:hypothetical protein